MHIHRVKLYNNNYCVIDGADYGVDKDGIYYADAAIRAAKRAGKNAKVIEYWVSDDIAFYAVVTPL